MRISITSRHLFFPGSSPVENAETLRVWLEALIGTNLVYLDHHPGTPPLYKSGVVYTRTDDWEPIGDLYQESYHGTDRPDATVPKKFGRFGDCKSLACAWIAEQRRAGKPADPSFRYRIDPVKAPPGTMQTPDGRWIAPDGRVLAQGGTVREDGTLLGPDGTPRLRILYHILVRTGVNTYEDPSKVCGMTDDEWAYL